MVSKGPMQRYHGVPALLAVAGVLLFLPSCGDGDGALTAPVVERGADVSVELWTARTSYGNSEPFDIVATVRNHGPAGAREVSGSLSVNFDFLVEGEHVYFEPPSLSCYFAPISQVAHCTAAELAPGESFQMRVVVYGPYPGPDKEHTAKVQSEAPFDPEPANNFAVVLTTVEP